MAVGVGASVLANVTCMTVARGHHYPQHHSFIPRFINASHRTVGVTFAADAAKYNCSCVDDGGFPQCMMSWSKLWGSSRCGFLHSHHQDSDRFVWRRQMFDGKTPGSLIEVAAYAYDHGVKPYFPPDPNLLQPFTTTLQTGVEYELALDIEPAASHYTLSHAATGATLETKTVVHHNACARATEGYRLDLYYGGQCTAPSDVTVCYTDERPALVSLSSTSGLRERPSRR